MRCLALALAFVVLLSGCGGGARVDASTRVVRIKVTQSGDIYLDGQLRTMGEVTGELERLKREKGAVLYYREETPQHQAHPNALKVIHKIEELNLPIGLSEKDFN